jgi:hypothetical protein
MWLGHRVQLLMVAPAMFGISSSGMVGKVSTTSPSSASLCFRGIILCVFIVPSPRDGVGIPRRRVAGRPAGVHQPRPPPPARRRETAR